jgi:hypothetical protein
MTSNGPAPVAPSPEGPPFHLAHLMALMRQNARRRAELLVGPGALVGRLPEGAASTGAEGKWAFRTQLTVQATTARLADAGLAPDMLVWPLVRRGITAGLRTTIRVGRSPANDVVLAHADVSKLHLRLVPLANAVGLTDEDSLNGTFVNGTRVAKEQVLELRSADRVDLGTTGRVRLQYFTAADLLAALGP